MDRQKKTVCLLTPNHIATNPRLVKEGIALQKAGYHVHLVFTVSDPGGDHLDRAILQDHPRWTYDVLDWSGRSLQSKRVRIVSGLKRKLSEKLFGFFRSGRIGSFVINRHFSWQVKKAIAAKADLYIAHNLGALAVAKAAAQKRGVRFGFDAEDFHRNELSDDPADLQVVLKAAVEETYLPQVDHFTAASPLIGNAYQQLFPQISPTVILNVFPKVKPIVLPKKKEQGNTIKLFWFSQTVGENRGLETIVKAMGYSKRNCYELHLLGNRLPGYKEQLEGEADNLGLNGRLFFYDPVPEYQIFTLAAQFDIGMATEVGTPYNRDICLTNKIFTYMQTGLAVIASNTQAQVAFLQDYPMSGKLYQKEDPVSLATQLDFFCDHPDELQQCKSINFKLGQKELNWESEQTKFIHSLQELWNNNDRIDSLTSKCQ